MLLNVSLRLLLNLSFDGQQRKEIVDAGLLPRLVALMNKPAVSAANLRKPPSSPPSPPFSIHTRLA